MTDKKRYFLKVFTLSLLLSAVLISSVSAMILSSEEITSSSFVFSLIYTAAWVGITILAHCKNLKTVQYFSAVYLGISAVFFLVATVMSVFTSLTLPAVISFAVMLEIYPFFGWAYVFGGGFLTPIFCLILTGLMSAAAVASIKKGRN